VKLRSSATGHSTTLRTAQAAHRLPLFLAVAGAAGVCLAVAAWHQAEAPRGRDAVWAIVVGIAGLGALSSALPLYLARMKARVRVDITPDGVAVHGVLTPASAIRAIGLTGPVHDPVLTLWRGPAAGGRPAPPDRLLAVSQVGDRQIARARDRVETLWPGLWRSRAARPVRLLTATELTVDLAGRYHAAGEVIGGTVEVRHSMILRDEGAEPVLMLERFTRRLQTGARVTTPDGTLLGSITETGRRAWTPSHGHSRPLSLYDADGRLIGRTQELRRSSTNTIVDSEGRHLAVLDLPNHRAVLLTRFEDLLLRIDQSAAGPLRPLLLALPLALRLIDIQPWLNNAAVPRLEPIS
jgi:hypothetical protein